jgi:nucleoid DNA-binding protein
MSIEEAEAIRLKDLEGLEQEQGAEKMNISRPTFQRVLASARQKIADALLNGKAIRIDGGNFEMTWRRFRCHRGHEWELETPVSLLPEFCPTCSEPSVEPIVPAKFGLNSREHGWRRRRPII